MNINTKQPPRKYRCGLRQQIEISDCGEIHPEPNEQLTFFTPDGKEYDVAAKEWGFYATPSVNGRLVKQGFKTALVRNSIGQLYVMIVDTEKIEQFETYLSEEEQSVVEWIDERNELKA